MSSYLDLTTIPISELGLSESPYNALGRAGITNFSALLKNFEQVFACEIKHLTPEKVKEVQGKLGLWLKNHLERRTEQVAPAETQDPERPFDQAETDEIAQNISFWFALRKTVHPQVIEQFDAEADITEYLDEFRDSRDKREKSKRRDKKPVLPIPLQSKMALEISILRFLQSLLPTHKKVILDFYGFYAGQPVTLQIAANLHGITRERIRQIKIQVLDIFHRQQHYLTLEAYIKSLIKPENGIISNQRLIEKMNHELERSGWKADGILALYRDHNKTYKLLEVVYLSFIDSWSSSDYPFDTISMIAQTITEIIRKANTPLHWNNLYQRLTAKEGLYSLDEEFAIAIINRMRDVDKVEQLPSGAWVLPSTLSKRQNRVIFVLKQIGEPAHFTEITRVHKQLFPEIEAEPHNIHAVLGSNPKFVRVGRGKYGLSEWGLHDDGNLANAVRRVLIEAKTPLNLDEIITEVLKTWEVSTNSIVIADQNDARFEKTAEGKYKLTPLGQTIKKTHKRSDDTRRNRILYVLQIINHPETYQQITQTHNELFPDKTLTSPYVLMILNKNKDLFVCLERSIFGLVQWGVNKDEYIADKIYTRLSETGEPIYIGGGPLKFSRMYGFTQEEIRSAGLRDDRLKIINDYLVLSEWGAEATAEKIQLHEIWLHTGISFAEADD